MFAGARLRGRTPLVLVPVANPESAASLMGVAATVRTPGVGRILLLSVIETGAGGPSPDHPALRDAPAILAEALRRSFERSATPETLFTIAPDAWQEIRRVAREQRCETVLLGSPRLQEPRVGAHAQELMAQLDTDVVIVRAPHRWRVNEVRRILVPTGGRRDHSRLRTRLLASLTRTGGCRLCYLHALPRDATAEQLRRAERELRALAEDEAEDTFQILVETGESPLDVILRHADDCDLVVMGVRREGPRRRTLEGLPAAVIRRSEVPLVLIGGQRG